jgi:hypothetical protein
MASATRGDGPIADGTPPRQMSYATPLVGERCGLDCVGVGRAWPGRRGCVRLGHRVCTCVAVVVAVLAVPATAAMASPPAVDQYTQHLPTAGGSSRPTGDEAPVAQLEQLPSKTQAALSSEPDGQVLAQIATASTLGAPAPAGSTESAKAGNGTSGNARGYATVVADSAGTGSSLALAGALVGIASVGAWNRLSKRRRSSADV